MILSGHFVLPHKIFLLLVLLQLLAATLPPPPPPPNGPDGLTMGGASFTLLKDPLPIQNCKLHFTYENAPTKTKKYIINPGKACCMIEFVNITRIGKMECRKDCYDYGKFGFLNKPPRITSFECDNPVHPDDWSHEELLEKGLVKFNCDSRRKKRSKQCVRRQKYFANCCNLDYELPSYVCDFKCKIKI